MSTSERQSIWTRFGPYLLAGIAAVWLVFNLLQHSMHAWLTGYLVVISVGGILLRRQSIEAIRQENVPTLKPAQRADSRTEPLPLFELLLREFDYVKETAAQAMNDRLTMVNYFLLSAGILGAGFGYLLTDEKSGQFVYRYETLIALSLVFNFIGWIYFMQIVRLRQAWCESARAMNHIKLAYLRHCEYAAAPAEHFFRWQVRTIPPAAKKMTVFHLSALLISVISTFAIIMASAFTMSLAEPSSAGALHKISAGQFTVACAAGLLHIIYQMTLYTALLEEHFTDDDSAPKARKTLTEK